VCEPHKPIIRTDRQFWKELLALVKTLAPEEKSAWRTDLIKWGERREQ
jgi:hypothetical protein